MAGRRARVAGPLRRTSSHVASAIGVLDARHEETVLGPGAEKFVGNALRHRVVDGDAAAHERDREPPRARLIGKGADNLWQHGAITRMRRIGSRPRHDTCASGPGRVAARARHASEAMRLMRPMRPPRSRGPPGAIRQVLWQSRQFLKFRGQPLDMTPVNMVPSRARGRRGAVIASSSAAFLPAWLGRGTAAAWPRAGRIDAPPPWSGLVKATRATLLSESRGCFTGGTGGGTCLPATPSRAWASLLRSLWWSASARLAPCCGRARSRKASLWPWRQSCRRRPASRGAIVRLVWACPRQTTD